MRKQPDEYLPLIEKATKRVYQTNYHDTIAENPADPVPDFQVQIMSEENPRNLRDLTSNLIGQLVVVPGIVTSASRTTIKATSIRWRCSSCDHSYTSDVKFGFGGAKSKRECENSSNPLAADQKTRCPLDPYHVVPEECTFIDQQTLKLQEAPELIPTGEMPRSFLLTADRALTDKVSPGNRVKIVGILSIFQQQSGGAGATGQKSKGVNKSYIRIVGIQSF